MPTRWRDSASSLSLGFLLADARLRVVCDAVSDHREHLALTPNSQGHLDVLYPNSRKSIASRRATISQETGP